MAKGGGRVGDVSPPSISTRLLELVLPPSLRDAFVGDLIEELRRRQASEVGSSPTRWYRRQVLRSIGPMAWRRLNASAVAQTALSTGAGFAAGWAWLWLLNQPLILGPVFRLPGSSLAIVLVLLEASPYLIAGLAVGLLATAKPLLAVLATGALVWAWPLLRAWWSTGELHAPGGLWSAVMILACLLLGVWIIQLVRRRLSA